MQTFYAVLDIPAGMLSPVYLSTAAIMVAGWAIIALSGLFTLRMSR